MANPGRICLLATVALLPIMFTSCGRTAEKPLMKSDMPRFLALGDSYTIGEGVRPEERWPVQLVGLLRAHGVELGEPTIVAKTGWSTSQLATAMTGAQLEGPYDLVSLLIGVNNQYRGESLNAYRTEFAELLRRAVELAGGKADHVLVLSIPDYSVTPFAARRDPGKIAREIDQFNAVNQEEARRAGVSYIEITQASRRAREQPDLIASDSLHPSGKMYAEWAEAALPQALKALAKH